MSIKTTIALMAYPFADNKRVGLRLGEKGKAQLNYAWEKFEFPKDGFDIVILDNSIFSQHIICTISELTAERAKRKEKVNILPTSDTRVKNTRHNAQIQEMLSMLNKQTLEEINCFKNKKEYSDHPGPIAFYAQAQEITRALYILSGDGQTLQGKNILIFHDNLFLQEFALRILNYDSKIKDKNLPKEYKGFLSKRSLRHGDCITITTNSTVTISHHIQSN